MVDIQKVPERIAYLTLLFLHKSIPSTLHDELDRWVEESDENMEMFEILTDLPFIDIHFEEL